MRHSTISTKLMNLMCQLFARVFLVVACATFTVHVGAGVVSIDTVRIGNPGNSRDDSSDGKVGDVDYVYRMGKYEVTNAQYAEFLNVKASSDPQALYTAFMGTDPRGGISRTGSDGSYQYEIRADMGNKPVTGTTFYSAIRFVNWLHNGQEGGDTETGAYTLLGGTPTPSNTGTITRSASAIWFLPNVDEWHKAAFYDPRTTAEGGPPGNDHYWLYPTKSDVAPIIATANSVGDISNPGANVANYLNGADWNSQDGNVTTVGSAGPLSSTFYGTLDQGGNLWEWTETLNPGASTNFREIRGGAWGGNGSDFMRATDQQGGSATPGGPLFGFRVAVIPEPSSLVLAAAGAIAGVILRRYLKFGGGAASRHR
jgi:formylglycine-generating enzyme required for sulfatase activity